MFIINIYLHICENELKKKELKLNGFYVNWNALGSRLKRLTLRLPNDECKAKTIKICTIFK